MIDLLAALKLAFNANVTLAAAFPGLGSGNRGFYVGLAPEGAALPFVVARGIAAPRENAYGTKDHADNTVEFMVVAAGLEAARQKAKTFIAQWDALTVPALDAGTCYQHDRYDDPVPDPEPEGKDENGADVWVWRITYEYQVSEF